ncbi:methyl-accepting chemotaxis protein [Eleftheria terrae]|uniref:methyl-accepting chemotaxis protein n=1 Tax=Eleftheria terrae TaxID=1597781 RepID=UPI00263B2AAB|nr:methyl-accepting chemotaxis protein [Eleftheria terrae]WKB50742.1 methyl-accepting chemotaxis protein [Eleftheria terrae]
MLSDIKISVRLIAAFLIVAAFCALVGLVGITVTAKINDKAERMYDTELLGLSLVKEANVELTAVGRARANYMLAATTDDRARHQDAVTKALAAMKDYLAKAAPLLVSKEGQLILKAFATEATQYERDLQALLALASTRRLQEADEALDRQAQAALSKAKQLDGMVAELVRLKEARARQAAEEAQALYEQSRTLMIRTMVAALVGGVWLAFLISRSISRPLAQVVQAANRIAEGDLTVQLGCTTKDENGQLLQAMCQMVARLTEVARDVTSSAEALASASEEVGAIAQSLSQATSEPAAGVEESSASIEQITSRVAQNTENARLADGMAKKASIGASEVGEAVKEAVNAMEQIAQMIGITDDTAYQTGLLAQNAASKAARAGQHGKGFAVVAAEVRKLAERSQVAAQEIGMVASSSVDLAEKAGRLLDEIVPNIRKTSELVQDIIAASQEQSSGVRPINAAISQLSRTTQQNASSSEELAATAVEMRHQAQQLQHVVSFFKFGAARAGTPSEPKRPLKAKVRQAMGKVVAAASPGAAAAAALALNRDEASIAQF